ncbi:terminal nucleotidyltransferase 4B-like isoform X3 [Paramacrobiotus metropolitanus]|uniref:terminal nucleotidyltransferase 4B-like isoform X3 n=1 Tax=Paramacrobiotus metropolitanus TaxID=2943436 RepID=UPI002446356B|nr:terminal nucleotidyltransferase 4B-like isoform X3 [Paramacrobiotus metropolitanus]
MGRERTDEKLYVRSSTAHTLYAIPILIEDIMTLSSDTSVATLRCCTSHKTLLFYWFPADYCRLKFVCCYFYYETATFCDKPTLYNPYALENPRTPLPHRHVRWVQRCLPLNSLHEEIEDFANWIAPTPAEQRMRLELMQRLRTAVTKRFPDAVVDYYGSYRTGLYLPTSDIDVVLLSERTALPLYTVKDVLLQADIGAPESVKVLDRASVPIIKLTDRHTDVKANVSFNMVSGLQTAELVLTFLKEYPCLEKLVLVLKQFLQQHGLNESFTGGIGSYALVLLTVSFLQLHPRYNTLEDGVNVGALLIEFLELYGRHFNYVDTAIRIKDGGCHLAKEELWRDVSGCQRSPTFSIEDPLLPGNDVGRTSYASPQVKQAFESAYSRLYTAVVESSGQTDDKLCASHYSFLGRIIQVSDDINNYRGRINRQYPAEPQPELPLVPAATDTDISPSTSNSDSNRLPKDFGDLSLINPLISHSDDDCCADELAKLSNIHHSESSMPFVDANVSARNIGATINAALPRPSTKHLSRCVSKPSSASSSTESTSLSDDLLEPHLRFTELPPIQRSLSGVPMAKKQETRKHGGWDGSVEQYCRYRTRYFRRSRSRMNGFYLNDADRYPRKSASEIIREFEEREKERDAAVQTMTDTFVPSSVNCE